ncbi:MAG: hypothetical protein JJU06_05960 [Ectothiorhodospiraceae bacterium]|nr:hypothetical protein [Ectothiorhodospiraceae bacterium]
MRPLQLARQRWMIARRMVSIANGWKLPMATRVALREMSRARTAYHELQQQAEAWLHRRQLRVVILSFNHLGGPVSSVADLYRLHRSMP